MHRNRQYGVFLSVQWVCRTQTPSECVLDTTQRTTSELVGVGRGGDITWWKLWKEGGDINVEDTTLFSKTEFNNALRRYGYGEYILKYQFHICSCLFSVGVSTGYSSVAITYKYM